MVVVILLLTIAKILFKSVLFENHGQYGTKNLKLVQILLLEKPGAQGENRDVWSPYEILN